MVRPLIGPIDALLELRDIADGAETTDQTETAIDFVAADHGDFKVAVHVSALDTGDADETYVINVLADSAAAFDSAVIVASLTVTATGVFEIPLSGPKIEALEAGAIKLAVAVDVGGTTPSITYGAYVTNSAGS